MRLDTCYYSRGIQPAWQEKTLRQGGTLSDWNDEKGYGFIAPDGGSDKVFVHISGFTDKRSRPVQFQRVEFALATDNRGRPCARNVVRPGGERPADANSRINIVLYTIVGSFLIVVATLWGGGQIPLAIPAIYLCASLFTFGAYWKDKAAARAGRWRTSEQGLHLLSLVGGWPGALVAQRILNHKSRKVSFQVMYWVTVAMNVAALGWFLTAGGSQQLADMTDKMLAGY